MTYRRLLAVFMTVGAAVVPAAEAAAAKGRLGDRLLGLGSRGGDVRTLQSLLRSVGIGMSVDGHFGPQTRVAVRTWEERSERRVDGRVTRADLRVLRAQVRAGTRLDGRAAAPGGTAAPEQSELLATAEAVAVPAGARATIGPDGLAIPPADAPDVVKAIIAAGNEIHGAPYEYGGGHGIWDDSGYDCSGSISYALHGAGLLKQALDSTGFMSWGEEGPGSWVTIYANPGHAYMVVAGLRFDTSGRAERDSRWTTEMRDSDGFAVTHPSGL